MTRSYQNAATDLDQIITAAMDSCEAAAREQGHAGPWIATAVELGLIASAAKAAIGRYPSAQEWAAAGYDVHFDPTYCADPDVAVEAALAFVASDPRTAADDVERLGLDEAARADYETACEQVERGDDRWIAVTPEGMREVLRDLQARRQAAVVLGRSGGAAGKGTAIRSAVAKRAAEARWAKARPAK